MRTKPTYRPPKKTVTTPEVAPQTPPGVGPAAPDIANSPGFTPVPTGLFAPSTLTGTPNIKPTKLRGPAGKTAAHRTPNRTTG